MHELVYNISRIQAHGLGRFARAPGVRRASVAMAALPGGTVVEPARPAGTPLALFPVLAQAMASVGLSRFVATSGSYAPDAEALEAAITSIIRFPVHRVLQRLDMMFEFRYEADPGDIPQVHRAVRSGMLKWLDVQGIWDIAGPHLKLEELLFLAGRAKRSGLAARLLAHPLFPPESAPDLIMDHVVSSVRKPDLWITRKRIEKHIEEIGTGDFLGCPSGDLGRGIGLIKRGLWWHMFFSRDHETPEDSFCEAVYRMEAGLHQRSPDDRDLILQHTAEKYPQLAWLLREVEDKFQ